MKPDVFFNVHVCPKYYVHGCEEKRAQEARGLFGFHLYKSCPNCRVEFAGWELWGENGHMQGSITQFGDVLPTRERLACMMKNQAKRLIKLQNGKWQGTRFHVGNAMYYQGENK